MATFSQSLIAIMLSGQIFKKQFLQYQIVIHSKNGINNFSKRFFIPDFLRQIKFVAPHVVSIVEERIFDMTGVKIITRICESSPVNKFHQWSTFWTNELGDNFFFLLIVAYCRFNTYCRKNSLLSWAGYRPNMQLWFWSECLNVWRIWHLR